MCGWGYKTTWIATTATPEALSEVIGIAEGTPASWPDGVKAAHDRGVFVTPAVDGWTFAVGAGMSSDTPDVEALAAALGAEVQVFASHRVVELCSWMRAGPGLATRRFTWVGDQGELTVEGTATEVEQAHGIDAFAAAIADDRWDDIDGWPDEATVLEVADAWSINPLAFEDRDLADAVGTLGSRALS